MVFFFTENEATDNICNKGSSKTLSLHLLVHELNALELTLRSRLEVIHAPGITMITQGTVCKIKCTLLIMSRVLY
jgi:hypothetical protein